MSEIVRSVTGMTLGEYLHQRLLPLVSRPGRGRPHRPARRRAAGGFICGRRTWQKLGVLWLDGGRWEGEQILAARVGAGRLLNSAYAHKKPKKYGSFNYGYHIWIARDGSCTLFNGMFGQNVFMFP